MKMDHQAGCAEYALALSLLASGTQFDGAPIDGAPINSAPINSAPINSGLQPFVERGDELQGAEEHLVGCEACRGRYRQLLELASALRGASSLNLARFQSEKSGSDQPDWLEDAAKSVLGRLELGRGGLANRSVAEVEQGGLPQEVDSPALFPVAGDSRLAARDVESEKVQSEKVQSEKVQSEKVQSEKVQSEKVQSEKVQSEYGRLRESNRLRGDRYRTKGPSFALASIAVASIAVAATTAALLLVGWFTNGLGMFSPQTLPAENLTVQAVDPDQGLSRERNPGLAGQAKNETKQAAVAEQSMRVNPGIATWWELRQSVGGVEGEFEKVLARGGSGGDSGWTMLRVVDRELMQ